jgi:FlaA1/EpsC-like NDP-sugar epimerase
MLDGKALAERHPADLLGRPLRGQRPVEAARWLEGRRVAITGAGGSVGLPLAAAIAAAGPAGLLLLDHHEASLWELHRRFGDLPAVSLALADVRHRDRLVEVLRAVRPEVVFHLAAYKQVPFGEQFSGEVFAVNVLGTGNLLELAAELGVERLVYPSSDKACNPPSVYGATKRLAETLVRQAALVGGRRYNVARFVNILGTRGSVIETFARQVRSGDPLTVTDPAMTRYWIAMDEALWLLLSVAELPTGGQTLLVDPGPEIAVVEIAQRVCRLLRKRDEPCELRFGQPRPGERLREELHSDAERLVDGPQAGLWRIEDPLADQHLARLPGLLAELIGLADQPERLRVAMMAAARQLQ